MLTTDQNDEPTKFPATVCAGQTTNYNDEIRGRIDRQDMIQCERCSSGPAIDHGEGGSENLHNDRSSQTPLEYKAPRHRNSTGSPRAQTG